LQVVFGEARALGFGRVGADLREGRADEAVRTIEAVGDGVLLSEGASAIFVFFVLLAGMVLTGDGVSGLKYRVNGTREG
jgi:hypothetical protein